MKEEDVALDEEDRAGNMAAPPSNRGQQLQRGTVLYLTLSFILGFITAVILLFTLDTWLGNGSYESGFETEIGRSPPLMN